MKSKKQTKKQSKKVEIEQSIDKVEKAVNALIEIEDETQAKVKRFRSLNYDDNKIAALLEIPVAHVKEIK